MQQTQNQTIIDRLAVLPELKNSIENLTAKQAELSAVIVPRPELEARSSATKARIDRLDEMLESK